MKRSVIGIAAATLAMATACGGGAVSKSADKSAPGASDGQSSNGNNTSTGGSSGGGSSGGGSGAQMYVGKTPFADTYSFRGRFDVSDPSSPLMEWESSAVGVHFSGSTQISATLKNVEGRIPNNTLQVRVDGKEGKKIVFDQNTSEYVLATGLTPGEHEVWITKIQEFGFGPVAFGGFHLDSGAKVLAPPAARKRHVEFIGSSTLSGWGADSADYTDADCKDETNFPTGNSEHAIPRYTADALDADFQNLSRGANGIAVTFTPGVGLLPQAYDYVVDSSTDPWDFSQWNADVVVIEAGGSDFTLGDGPPAIVPVGTLTGYDSAKATSTVTVSIDDFKKAYTDFLDTIRKNHPGTTIILVNTKNFVGQSKDIFPKSLDEIASSYSDGKVLRFDYFATPLSTPSKYADYWAMADALGQACDGHPTPEEGQIMGGRLAEFIKSKLGW